MAHLPLLIQLLQFAAKDRVQLALENAALRHELAVLKRSVARPRIEDSDWSFRIMLRRTMREWRDALIFVKPDTVVRWHRNGYKHYWRRMSPGPIGRPPIGESTVAKYMERQKPTPPGQSWSTFLGNHMDVTAAWDFFVVPTLTFKLLYMIVVLDHGRRRILNFNVTFHPTVEWTARQLVETFPMKAPGFLLPDRDSIYSGWAFKRMVDALIFGLDRATSIL